MAGALAPAALLESPAWEALALAIGLIVGSFANVCIHRLPRRESLASPGSRCPRCATPIRVRDNVPLLSFLLLRGRCRHCGAAISLRYPAVEAANGLAYLGLAASMGPQPLTVVSMALVTALLVLSLIDLQHFILPNAITLPGIGVGLAASLLPGDPTPVGSTVATVAGYLAMAGLAKAWWRLRHVHALGQGDWKLVAMLGAFLGWQKMLLTVLLAAVAGSLVGLVLIGLRLRSARDLIPLGTFLGFAGIVVVFVGDGMLAWYRGLLRV